MPKALALFLVAVILIASSAVIAYLVESFTLCMILGFCSGWFIYAPIIQHIFKSSDK